MATLNLSGIKAGGSTLLPQPKNSSTNTLKVGGLNTNPALKMQTPNVALVSNQPNPANSFNISVPRQTVTSPSVNVPKSISSETLSYTPPKNQVITQPYPQAQNALTSTLDTYASQPAPLPEPINERDQLLKDRQSAWDIYNNKDTGYSATSLKMQTDAGIFDKQKQIDDLDLQDQAIQRQQAKITEEILKKNPQGLFGGAGQQLISQNERDLTSQRADLAYTKAVLNGDVNRASNIIKLKLDAQFSPVKERMDFIEKTLTIRGNDMSESQKSQATKELYQLKEQDDQKKAFDKIAIEAQQNGATQEEVNQARLLYSNGDRAGAVNTIADYAKNSDLTPYQQFTTTQAIAKDTQKRTENAREMARQAKLIQDSYNSILKGGDRSLNTQAIITSFNKILDPTSVVRESEYDRTAQGQALVEQLRGKYDQIIAGGAGVTEATLKEASDIAKQYLQSSQQSINIENERARAMARQFGLNEDFVGSTGTTQSQWTSEMENKLLQKYTPQQVEQYKKARGFSSVGSDTKQATGKEIVAGYDITSYATDPTHGVKVNKIFSQIPQVKTEMDVDSYIRRIAPNSPVKGNYVVNASNKYGVDPRLILAIMVQDSTLGTAGKAVRTKNPGNVGNTDSGATKTFASWEQGVDAVAKNLAWRKINQA